ncbi:WhiB family transcriptional regulator [Streptomyces chengbuensis]|uniref:WhiB family transcriptional regulator n=1 Tax=Streptomyces chengbuensis TaxID=3053466 RepID=UPI0025B430CE|nr:WhiB family transcriptional regulator [Streptomyces sp. HUAS CB01]WJY50105.1 WhiB family transcriptional regulator [Streptomyces sp. HUAS CB01]
MHRTDTAQPRALGDHTWRDRAACRSTPHHQVDPELFFPEPDEVDRIAAAKALCAQCPVRSTCLDAALENGDRDGIRGGMTEEERELLHGKLGQRLNYSRVNEALSGRDIHLTKAERKAVVRAAYQADIPAERLARILKVTEAHAGKLYRRTRREIRNRAVDQQKKANEASKTPDNAPRALKNPAAKLPARDDLGTAA